MDKFLTAIYIGCACFGICTENPTISIIIGILCSLFTLACVIMGRGYGVKGIIGMIFYSFLYLGVLGSCYQEMTLGRSLVIASFVTAMIKGLIIKKFG